MSAAKLIKIGLITFLASTVVLMPGIYLVGAGWEVGQVSSGGGDGGMQFFIGMCLLGLAGMSSFVGIALVIIGLVMVLAHKARSNRNGRPV